MGLLHPRVEGTGGRNGNVADCHKCATGWSVGRVNCYSPSPAQSVLVSCPIGTVDHILPLSEISRVLKRYFFNDKVGSTAPPRPSCGDLSGHSLTIRPSPLSLYKHTRTRAHAHTHTHIYIYTHTHTHRVTRVIGSLGRCIITTVYATGCPSAYRRGNGGWSHMALCWEGAMQHSLKPLIKDVETVFETSALTSYRPR
jgi:hypothetical protein